MNHVYLNWNYIVNWSGNTDGVTNHVPYKIMAENFYSGNRHRPLPRPLLPPARPLGAWNTPGSSLQDQTGGLDIDQEDLLRAYQGRIQSFNGGGAPC